jgi:hypothetical protein
MRTINEIAIALLAVILFSGCARDKKEWRNAVELNTIQNFEQFRLKYPESAYSDSASIKIEELAFNDALLKNNINEFKSFLDKYPESSLREMAGSKIIELELAEAYSSKDILKVVEKINSNPESQVIKELILTDSDSLEIKPKNSIHEDFITKVLYSENKNIVQFILPPDREIGYEIGEIFDGLEVTQGEIIGVLNLGARGMIQDQSGEEGCTLKMTNSPNELLYALTNILIIGKGTYVKISDNAFLYSADENTKLERIRKTNSYKVTGGRVYLIKM